MKLHLPNCLVFDTIDACNLNCLYCGRHDTPQHPVTLVPLEAIEHLLAQTRGWNLKSINPYLAGETLLETRLPEIVKIIHKHNPAPITIFTNGTIYANRQLLPCANAVHFTVSAVTPETYTKIHGRPLYHEAVKTIEWLEAQPNHPEITLTFVMIQQNIHELPEWREQWSRFKQSISPASVTPVLKLPLEIENANMTPNFDADKLGLPCTFWDVLLVHLNGQVPMCCGGAPLAFGNIYRGTPLLEAWKRRCITGFKIMDGFCRQCRYRARNWQTYLKDWFVE